MIRLCNPSDKQQAIISQGLENNPTLKMLESSLKALTALSISIKTKTLKDKVDAFFFP